jgi:ABC-type transport system substrate-binding protein
MLHDVFTLGLSGSGWFVWRRTHTLHHELAQLLEAILDKSDQNPKLDRIITNARFAESKVLYDSFVRDMIQIAYDEVPRIPLFQPNQDVAMQANVMGYQYWFHLQPDYRQLWKA